MSHFAVLVIGNDVDTQMAPYHEFECTGRADEYVIDVDQTAEIYAEFESDTVTRYKDTNGVLHIPHEDEFYRVPTEAEQAIIGPLGGLGCGQGLSWHSKDWGDGRGYKTRVHYMPEGWTETEIPRKQVETFEEYVEDYHGKKIIAHEQQPDLEEEHKYGYAQLGADGKVAKIIDRTNPNKKWDWYVIGGGWTGAFKLKPGKIGQAGKRGLMTERCPAGYADRAFKGDIDFEAMRNDAIIKARAKWKTCREITGGMSWDSWDDMMLRYPDREEARREYHDQPAVTMLRESKNRNFMFIDDDLALEEETYITRQADSSCTHYAFVRDSQWTERGKMGWFGMSSDEISEPQWNSLFNRMLMDLPDDTLLTVVDCHI